MQINKYTLKKELIGVPQSINLPMQRRVYHVDFFQSDIRIWYGVEDNENVIHEPVWFVILYTGDRVPNDLHFFKTVIDHRAGLVYHIFNKR